jgi:hypothetical protein
VKDNKGLASGQAAYREALPEALDGSLGPLEGSARKIVRIRASVPVGTLCPETGNPQENLKMVLTSDLFREVNGHDLGLKSPLNKKSKSDICHS